MNSPASLLVIISSPSGGGKDAVINALLKRFKNSARLVTTTSRPPRPGNREGRDYYFISESEFKNKIDAGDFVEYNYYAGNYYGTQKKHLAESLKKYDLILTQIEVNGRRHLDEAGIPHLAIYLLPENKEILRRRIEKRGGIDEETIKQRLAIANQEIKASKNYDYRLINAEGKLSQTIETVFQIIRKRLILA